MNPLQYIAYLVTSLLMLPIELWNRCTVTWYFDEDGFQVDEDGHPYLYCAEYQHEDYEIPFLDEEPH